MLSQFKLRAHGSPARAHPARARPRAHLGSSITVAASPLTMTTLALKARDLFWRSKPQKSAPVLDVPTSDGEDSEDESAHPPTRKRRRTRVEVHGVTPSRRSTRHETSADVVPASVPRLASGAPMFQRDNLRDLSAQERLMFVNAVDNGKLQGRTMMEVASEWVLGEECVCPLQNKSRNGIPNCFETEEVKFLLSYRVLSSITKQLGNPFLDLRTLKMPSTRKFSPPKIVWANSLSPPKSPSRAPFS